jgi:hypothetical protein
MKYRVHIKWQCIAETEAESEQDAINYVLHSALKPKLAETKAVPVVNGRAWMKATAEETVRPPYSNSRKENAIPRWKRAYELRQSGKKWHKVAEIMNEKDPSYCAKMAANYEEYLLNQKTKKAA